MYYPDYNNQPNSQIPQWGQNNWPTQPNLNSRTQTTVPVTKPLVNEVNPLLASTNVPVNTYIPTQFGPISIPALTLLSSIVQPGLINALNSIQQQQQQQPPQKESTSTSRTLFVGNLPLDVDEDVIGNYFSRFGIVTEVKLMDSKHFCFVTFAFPSDAQSAKNNAHGQILRGRPMRINWGRPSGPMTQKEMALVEHPRWPNNRNDKKKKESGNSYLNFYKHVIEAASDPNNTTLFIGNLSSKSTEENVREHFIKFGAINEVKLRSEKHYGFVTFAKRLDAEEAKKSLDGQVFLDRPIRLGWGTSSVSQKDENYQPESLSTHEENYQTNDEEELLEEGEIFV